MKIQIILFAILASILQPGCESTANKSQPLILTCEDKALMRKPYTPCPGDAIPVDCSCK